MKNFFISFLGALAGIWFSLLLLFVGIFVVAGAAMISSFKSSSPVKTEKHSVLKLDLSGTVHEEMPDIDFDIWSLVDGGGIKDLKGIQLLSDITGSIVNAADDDNIEGIVIECAGLNAGLAQRSAIIEALKQFKAKAPEKWIYAYGDMISQGDYYIAASTADSLFVNPVGAVQLHGLSMTSLYYHRLLEKLGVEIQVVKVGTYKSAVEPYILDGMSEPAREQAQLFLNNIWQNIYTSIAEGRGVDPATVNGWADDFVFTADPEKLPEMKIVDRLMYRHEFDRKIADLTDREEIDDIRTVSPREYAKTADFNKVGNGKGATIAILYASGEISDTEGDGIVAADLVPEILELADDDDIDGLIMRVNSPGGSAFASEQIWEALQQFKKITGKPFYVSMSDYAASGGYYISCGADKIFAQPTTLTGSIGIFGMIPNFRNLMADKIGVTTSTVKTNANGNFPNVMEPMTPAQKSAMQAYVDRGYELFTSRCAEGRGIPQDSIKKIGEGRVWDGSEALRIGLVDQLGNLDAAIEAMARELSVESYTLSVYPKNDDKWYTAILDAGLDIKSAIIRSELGEMGPLYESINRIKGMSTLQTRMDFTEVNL